MANSTIEKTTVSITHFYERDGEQRVTGRVVFDLPVGSHSAKGYQPGITVETQISISHDTPLSEIARKLEQTAWEILRAL